MKRQDENDEVIGVITENAKVRPDIITNTILADISRSLAVIADALLVQSKTGHWINLEKTKYKGQVLPFWGRYGCSECGNYGQGDFDFCPYCGAKMQEVEE